MREHAYSLILLFVALFGCSEGRNVRGIAVSQEMIDGGDMNGFNYYLLYKNALDGDTSSIKDYSTIENFDGGYIYVHGVYLIRLIDRIGDSLFLKSIEGTDNNQRSKISLYIEAAMDIYEDYHTGEGAEEYTSIKDFWDKHPQIWLLINCQEGESETPTTTGTSSPTRVISTERNDCE